MACSEAKSICLRADEPARESGRGVELFPDDVIGVGVVCVVAVGAVEHAAVRRATTTR
jgi:hypothetical protein